MDKTNVSGEWLRDGGFYPIIDKASWFYKNCKRQRKRGAKICQECPFRSYVEEIETTPQDTPISDIPASP